MRSTPAKEKRINQQHKVVLLKYIYLRAQGEERKKNASAAHCSLAKRGKKNFYHSLPHL